MIRTNPADARDTLGADTASAACPDLVTWRARPLAEGEAEHLDRAARLRAQVRYRQGRSCLVCQLDAMIARFWRRRSIEAEYLALSGSISDPLHRALIETLYGQLTVSRRLQGAMDHLQRGFDLARPVLPARDFFALLERYRLLSLLPLGSAPRPARDLDELLNEARVIERLRGAAGGGSVPRRHDPGDTLG